MVACRQRLLSVTSSNLHPLSIAALKDICRRNLIPGYAEVTTKPELLDLMRRWECAPDDLQSWWCQMCRICAIFMHFFSSGLIWGRIFWWKMITQKPLQLMIVVPVVRMYMEAPEYINEHVINMSVDPCFWFVCYMTSICVTFGIVFGLIPEQLWYATLEETLEASHSTIGANELIWDHMNMGSFLSILALHWPVLLMGFVLKAIPLPQLGYPLLL